MADGARKMLLVLVIGAGMTLPAAARADCLCVQRPKAVAHHWRAPAHIARRITRVRPALVVEAPAVVIETEREALDRISWELAWTPPKPHRTVYNHAPNFIYATQVEPVSIVRRWPARRLRSQISRCR
jgi:hypothetical protein